MRAVRKLTRRQLAGTLAAAAAIARPKRAEAAPGDEMQAARDRNTKNAAALAQVSVAMDVEPAFHYTA